MTAAPRLATLLQAIPEGGEIESPLPGGLAAVVRFFLSFPQPLQIAGLVVGILLVVVLAVVGWRRRREIRAWATGQDRVVYIAAAVVLIALATTAAAAGVMGWNYVQHDNEFCTGCHVMRPAFVRFTESEHAEMQCHDCHQQPISASMRQLVLWVANRPEEVGPHAPVSNDVCVRCHVQEDADDTWENIRHMQGHEVHLESDSSALAEVQCVTCHGRELHRFVPSSATCGQSGCHSEETTDIVLGEMAGAETAFHCTVCHDFRAPLGSDMVGEGPEAQRAAMMPGMEECASCHAMEPVIEELALADDPHQQSCGWCHNPHAQETTEAAWNTCTGSGCHSDPRSLTTFHRGVHSDAAIPDCSQCHQPHTWELDGENCLSCHEELP